MNVAFIRAFSVCALALSIVSASPAVRAADPLDVNVILNLTGPGTFLGKAEEQSIGFIERRVNAAGGIKGRPVHFVIHDDATNPAITVQLMNQFIGAGVPLVLGSSLAANCLSTVPIVKTGPVDYCFSPSIYPASGTMVFSSGTATKDVALAYVRFFRSKGWKKLAMIASVDASGQDADESFKAALEAPENKGGVEMVSQQHFTNTDLSVTAQMTSIKAANPNVIVAYAPGTPFGTLLRGAKDVGITQPIVTGTGNMSYAEMKQYADVLPKELYFPGAPVFAALSSGGKTRPAEAAFIAAFKGASNKPDQLSTFAWDSTSIAIEALKKLGDKATAEQIRSYIANLHDYDGVLGKYDFHAAPQRGLDVNDIMIVRWDAARDGWTSASDLGGFKGK